jgi:hypothetical protein
MRGRILGRNWDTIYKSLPPFFAIHNWALSLKVHKPDNCLGSDFEICTFL